MGVLNEKRCKHFLHTSKNDLFLSRLYNNSKMTITPQQLEEHIMKMSCAFNEYLTTKLVYDNAVYYYSLHNPIDLNSYNKIKLLINTRKKTHDIASDIMVESYRQYALLMGIQIGIKNADDVANILIDLLPQ